MRSIPVAMLSLVALLSAPVAFAHEGHHKKIMGAVTNLDQHSMVVKTREGKSVSVSLSDDTMYRDRTTKASLSDLKVGDRVVVTTMGKGAGLSADEVRFAHAKGKTTAAKPAPESSSGHSAQSHGHGAE